MIAIARFAALDLPFARKVLLWTGYCGVCGRPHAVRESVAVTEPASDFAGRYLICLACAADALGPGVPPSIPGPMKGASPMAKAKKLGELQDFSARYRGAEQIAAQQGEWFEFSEVGDELVGEYRGMEPFRNGFKGTIRDTKGKLAVFSCATLLRQQLQELKVGDRIAIVLSGFQQTDQASPLKVFQVFRLAK